MSQNCSSTASPSQDLSSELGETGEDCLGHISYRGKEVLTRDLFVRPDAAERGPVSSRQNLVIKDG